MLSGVGPQQALAEHGISAVVDLQGVGANLQDHPAVLLAAK
jgi:choline dehydrogenase